MHLGITGASGFIGRRVIDIALGRGHEVVAFTRSPERGIPGCEMRKFALDAEPDLSGCDAVIHLAGESVAGIWTAAKKRRIRESRVIGTQRIAEVISKMEKPPEVFVCGSAIGFYADAGDAELTEKSASGTGFLAETVKAWEAEAASVQRARVVMIRTGIVLGKSGGALRAMTPIFRAWLGGQLGDGRQWMPWIHLEDEARLILFAVENLDIHGPVNATAPWPARNADFTRALARALRKPALFRVPKFALKLLGEMSHELLDSKRVLPAVATKHGFGFQFPELEPALKNIFA